MWFVPWWAYVVVAWLAFNALLLPALEVFGRIVAWYDAQWERRRVTLRSLR